MRHGEDIFSLDLMSNWQRGVALSATRQDDSELD
jgi:hypothetical protein